VRTEFGAPRRQVYTRSDRFGPNAVGSDSTPGTHSYLSNRRRPPRSAAAFTSRVRPCYNLCSTRNRLINAGLEGGE